MFIATIKEVSCEEFEKAFNLGRHIYDYENPNDKFFFKKSRVIIAKQHIVNILHEHGLDLKDKKDLHASDVFDPLLDYDLSFQSIAWDGYFVYAILRELHYDKKDPGDSRDHWIKVMEYGLTSNPGYASVIYDETATMYHAYKHINKAFEEIMKKSYKDTYNKEFIKK